jgi:hypothetical protein
MYERCVDTKDRLLREHTPEALNADTAKEVDKIVAAAKQHLSADTGASH